MPIRHIDTPSIDRALESARNTTFRGNTYGQNGDYLLGSDSQREVANNFNLSKAIQDAKAQRREAGLD